MSDRDNCTADPERETDLQEIHAGLMSADEADWNQALRAVLLRLLAHKRIWFATAAQIGATADRQGKRAALVELVMVLAFEG